MTHEIIHSMEKSKNQGMAFKLDISKAYDRVRWKFLYYVLAKFGFNDRVIGIIRECVEYVQYLVLVNGIPWGSFKAGKGLRQGDPLSPYLFIMVVEVSGRNFLSLLNSGKIQGIRATSTLPSFSNSLLMIRFFLESPL